MNDVEGTELAEVAPRGQDDGDVEAFGRALASLVVDPERIRRYGQASSRRVRRFTVDAMVERTLAAYRGRLAAEELSPPAPDVVGDDSIDEELAGEAVTS